MRIAVIGSYREDFEGLLALCRRLSDQGLEVIHPPLDARIIGEEDGFVRLSTDQAEDYGDIQSAVFALLEGAAAVVLYAPSGHVGTSAALEVGYALRAGVAVIPTSAPADATLRSLLASGRRATLDTTLEAAIMRALRDARPD